MIENNGKKVSFTHFQLRVWEAVLAIPFGQTRSYSWVARRIGSPGAARAVGSALRKNPYPLIIPCHRVVKSSGDIGEYSRGRSAKRQLIELEKRLKIALRLGKGAGPVQVVSSRHREVFPTEENLAW